MFVIFLSLSVSLCASLSPYVSDGRSLSPHTTLSDRVCGIVCMLTEPYSYKISVIKSALFYFFGHE